MVRCEPEFAWIHDHAGGWQFGESGMLAAAVARMGITGRVVEFGAGDGTSTHLTSQCLIDSGWKAVLIEPGIADAARLRSAKGSESVSVVNDLVTLDNINSVVPACEVLIIDVDGPEYYLWSAFNGAPQLVMLEHADWCNPEVPDDPDIPPLEECGSVYPPADPSETWVFQRAANESALRELARSKGYERVFATRINSLFVRSDVAQLLKDDVAASFSINNAPRLLEIHKVPPERLEYRDNAVGNVYACHVLEHFPRAKLPAIVTEWVRVLKPGGKLRVSVPDFRKVCEGFLSGQPAPWQGFAFGSQQDENDYHLCGLDETYLRELFVRAGLVCIKRYESNRNDASALPISLNLEGVKPTSGTVDGPLGHRVVACMSVPRLGFMDNMYCAAQAFIPLGIRIDTVQGAFWGQCLERCMTAHENSGSEFILTLDYDTVFSADNVRRLVMMADLYPEFDAFAPLQVKREEDSILAAMDAKTILDLNKDVCEANTAHFGLTLIRTSALRKLPHPWFVEQPNSEGRWDDEPLTQSPEEFKGRIDSDIRFWHSLRENGSRLAVVPDVGIGHMQQVISWPDSQTLRPVHQYCKEYRKNGPPPGVRC